MNHYFISTIYGDIEGKFQTLEDALTEYGYVCCHGDDFFRVYDEKTFKEYFERLGSFCIIQMNGEFIVWRE